MVIEAWERNINARAKDVRGINEDMAELVKDMGICRYEAVMDGVTITYSKSKAHMIAL